MIGALWRAGGRSSGVPSGKQVAGAVIVGLVMVGAVKPSAADDSAPTASAAAAAPLLGAAAGCTRPDPTTKGCLTAVTAHGLQEVVRVFGPLKGGPNIRSAGCWDAHAWNPTSDHPKGRACDLFPDRAGIFPSGASLKRGWALAKWLRANAVPLRVRYVIFQGRIWQADINRDVGGWGRKYTGGGVYDPNDPTGGHYDHVHVSFQK